MLNFLRNAFFSFHASIFILLFNPSGYAQPLTPQEILDKTIAHYQSMKSFSSDGKRFDTTVFMGDTKRSASPFHIDLLQPDKYRISWGLGCRVDRPSVSCDDLHYTEKSSDPEPKDGSTDGTYGIFHTIPNIFFKKTSMLHQIKEPQLAGSEAINGEECFVIEGGYLNFTKTRVWVSKERFLLVGVERGFRIIPGQNPMPEMSRQQILEELKKGGLEPTLWNIATFDFMVNTPSRVIRTEPMSGNNIEFYINIRVDGLVEEKDF